MIAGRIVPALANTTASITGFAAFQLLTLVNSQEISLIKNCNFNTAINFYQINKLIYFYLSTFFYFVKYFLKKISNKPTCLHILALNTYYTICYKDYSLHKAPQKPT